MSAGSIILIVIVAIVVVACVVAYIRHMYKKGEFVTARDYKEAEARKNMGLPVPARR